MRRNSLYERVVFILVGLVLLIGAGLVARAAFWPTITYTVAVRIDADTASVWDMMSDPKQRVRWQRGLVDIIPLIEGDLMLGARNLVLFQAGEQRYEIEEEVVEYRPEQALHLVHTSDAFVAIIQYEMTGNNNSENNDGHSSTVTLRVQHSWHGFRQRVVAPFYYFQEKNYAQGVLQRLKELSQKQ